ncbi:MAG: sulfatase-like hydrolase/transferase [Gemmatimonadota bacterium]|nr:sulfatase-like hydrolase/transferase [Gemmatimonadota bacterium]MDE3014109.1 sulfatase-like hydrolase/transferase [Gemmatimonadota bacterium]
MTAASWFASCAPRPRPTNIVLIFTDDQGHGDIGVYGAEGFSTPHLDRLAGEGMRFTDFYASEGVCSASRASLLTGCYAPRVSIFGALSPGSQVGLHPDEVTIAELLKPLGYATAAVGKWHLGHGRQFLPLQHGFDEYFGLPYSNDMWPVDYDGNPVEEGGKSAYPPLPLIEGDEVIETVDELADQDLLTTRYTERAVRFVDRHADGPFFLYLAHSMPHVPLGVSDRFRGSSEQGMYGDVIQEIDWSVGQVLEALERNGVEDDTLVIFTSDNGPWLNYGNHGGSTGALREGKGTAFEGGPRVPAIMRWPGRIPAGVVCNRMASTIDVLPTVAAITGASLPTQPIDGVSILPLLLEEDGADPRQEFWFYYTGELRAVREGRWKRVFTHRTRSYVGVEPGMDGYPGPYAFPTVPDALYDLEADVGETVDVSADYPDVVARLEAIGELARAALGDRLMQRTGTEVRPPGRLSLGRPDTLAHAAVGGVVIEATPTDVRYPGAGPDALVDGRVGSGDFRDGRWLAYDGVDFEATLDLGTPQTVARVGIDCLQVQSAWILLPRAIRASVSTDGQAWRDLPALMVAPEADDRVEARLLSVDVGGAPVRYIRVHATNTQPLPEWHPGAGETGWIFVDEIVVDTT